MNMHVKPLGRSLALPACSVAVVRGFPLSSYGFVSVPARNASLAGLCLRIRDKVTDAPVREQQGESAWNRMSAESEEENFQEVAGTPGVVVGGSAWVPRQYCTEAMSEVGCNSSPILLGKLLDIIKLLCIECKFSGLGTTVILGRLEC